MELIVSYFKDPKDDIYLFMVTISLGFWAVERSYLAWLQDSPAPLLDDNMFLKFIGNIFLLLFFWLSI